VSASARDTERAHERERDSKRRSRVSASKSHLLFIACDTHSGGAPSHVNCQQLDTYMKKPATI
jgi:hypothetical protein